MTILLGPETRFRIAHLMLMLEQRGMDPLPRGVSAESMAQAGTLDEMGILFADAVLVLREMIGIGHAECTIPKEDRGGVMPEYSWVGLSDEGRRWIVAEVAFRKKLEGERAYATRPPYA
jgi:hypothetical protein